MRVRRVLLDGATSYDEKCYRTDIETVDAGPAGDNPDQADLVHFYGGAPPRHALKRLRVPYVASAAPRQPVIPWIRVTSPALLIASADMPEAVERRYSIADALPVPPRDTRVVGFFDRDRDGVSQIAEQTLARIHRFRGDVAWNRFDGPPSPEDLRKLDLWVDPCTVDDDLDGFVAEALVSGLLVVASRTPVNERRLDGGRAGFLVPPGDPNELAHTVLTALFKEELAAERRAGIAAAADKFTPERRKNTLLEIYRRIAE